ncbi:helix-turn-helix domain-containing protein [Parasalinivibrio latis]|uniref:helix-turn-helix domain-containing protein n=1 Tax=Parasalinivibrio latis TaxID=2952610 RepID=UPI0030E4EB3B
MGRLVAKVPAFEYLSGKELVDLLKKVYEVDHDYQLADWTGVPAPTIGTWKQRDLTPYELIIRTCLAKGISLEYLALGKGEPGVPGSSQSFSEILNAKRLEAGALIDIEPVVLDKVFLAESLNRENCLALLTDKNSYLINISDTAPMSGDYLIDVDGVFSINRIRRIPGKKLSVDFDGSLVEVAEGDIEVIGRVVATISKD